MSKKPSVSVCVATYNGEQYIAAQIESILAQLSDEDEIIVSDDGSADQTKAVVEKLMSRDGRIRMIDGPHDGFSKNFENAVKQARNDIVLFSDQDDIWEEGKVEQIKKIFRVKPETTTILHDMATFRNDSLTNTNEIAISYHGGVLRNFIKSSYWGCCMAVRREFLMQFIPFRAHCVGHDQLIGLMTEKHGKALYLNQKLLWHRLHGSNTSNRRTVKQMIVFRYELMKDYCEAEKQFKKHNR